MIDTRALEHFLAAVRHGSLTLAAIELGLTQPALTKSLRRLEAQLGVPLLERSRLGVSPTSFGEALVARGRRVRDELASAVTELAAMRGATEGTVVIGCGPTEATRLLPLAARTLAEEAPAIRLTVLYGLNEALMPWVRQGEVEFALSSVPRTASDPALAHETLHIESAAVIARAQHPLAERRKVTARDLLGFPWCLARRHELERRALDEMFLANDLRPPAAAIETTSTVLMKSVAQMTDFLTFLPRELIYWEALHGTLVPLAVSGAHATSEWSRHVGITRRAVGRLSPSAEKVIAILRDTAGELAVPAGRTARRSR
jgi:DNA-binding transcriptional LysR family regulator